MSFRLSAGIQVAPRRACARAFTLVELLVSIAIIFVLITAAIVALKKARSAATRTTSISALRQMGMAYTAYADAHDGRLMPGFVDPSLIGTTPTSVIKNVVLPSGVTLTAQQSCSYVWRLAPYLSNSWETLTVDYQGRSLKQKMTDDLTAGNALTIATRPSFGINSIFVGGDSLHGGAAFTQFSPWDTTSTFGVLKLRANRLAAVRMSEVKNPSNLIVFAPTRWGGPGEAPCPAAIPPDPATGEQLGYMELCAPCVNYNDPNGTALPVQWTACEDRVYYTGTTAAGLPVSRVGDGKVPLGFMDGSTGLDEIARLALDMSRWSPFQVSPQ